MVHRTVVIIGTPQVLDASMPATQIPSKKYTVLLRQIYPAYTQLATEIRLDMKRKVKGWLKLNVGKDFGQCRVLIDDGGKGHVTYCVPNHFETFFLKWAQEEINAII